MTKSQRTSLSSVSEASVEESTEESVRRKSKELSTGKKEESNDAEIPKSSAKENRTLNFGVKSYLHNFYDSRSGKNDEDSKFLIDQKSHKCGPIWFKIGLIMGATLFLLGAMTIVIGYAIPKQNEVVGKSGHLEVIDNHARRFNQNLDRCKLIGLAGFCSGGLLLVISLLAPTFASTYWDDDPAIEPFKFSFPSRLPQEKDCCTSIPFTEKIKCVQPSLLD